MKHKRRRHDDLSAVAFILRLAKDKAKEEVGPEFRPRFRSLSQAPTID